MFMLSFHLAVEVQTARTCKTKHVHITVCLWFGL